MSNLLALPLLLPVFMMIILIFIRHDRWTRMLALAGSALQLVFSTLLFVELNNNGILVLHAGSWVAPFGITLVLDYLGGLMLLVSSLIVFTVTGYSHRFMQEDCASNRFYVFLFSLALGLNGAFLTGDIFNLFVWFEVMLLSSFVLITYGSRREQLGGGIKYLSLNLIGSFFFLAGIGLLYSRTGTLNMAQLALIFREGENNLLFNAAAMLFFVAFGIKSALFPLHFWLPASYHTPNITITSLFAGLLTKVGVYAMIRFFSMFYLQDVAFWQNLLFVAAALTMVSGGMAATTQYETRRILSYHIISQIGYMIMGLAFFTPLGVAGAIFFAMHNMVAKTNAFFVMGLVNRLKGSFHLKEVGGLFKESPLLAVLFIIPAFALAGIPPLSGFFGKLILIKAGLDAGHYLVTAVAILTAMLTLYSMIKIWFEAFLKPAPASSAPITRMTFLDLWPSVVLALVSILLGLFAGPVFDVCYKAATLLLQPTPYIDAVLQLP